MKEKKIKVYIASPYTKGRMPDNVRRQLQAKQILMDYGFVPFAPLDNHFSEIYSTRPEEEWYQWDLEWLSVCDILIRIRPIINGEELPSIGSDGEEKLANELNILCFSFNTLKEVEEWAKNSDKKSLWKQIYTLKEIQ